MAATSSESPTARWEDLRAAVTKHKSAIRHHRDHLGAAKAALDAFEAECRQRGIHLIVEPPASGVGVIHGREFCPRS